MNMWKWMVCVAMGVVVAGPATQAQVVVRKNAGDKTSLDLSGFSASGAASAQFMQVLQNDLVRSGWFSISKVGGGEVVVRGGVRDNGGRLDVECTVVNTGNQQRLLAKTYTAGVSDVRQLAHKMNDEVVKAVTGKNGFASTRLAMVGNRSGKKEIYLCDSDGANLSQLTWDGSISLFPRWSYDGRRLVYTSYVKRYPDVLMVDLASGGRRQLSSFPGLNMGGAFSPDGRQLALILSRDGNPELYVMNVAGGGLTRLTRTPNAAESSPTWSPDGTKICYVSDAAGVSRPQLYIISREGGAPKRVTSSGPQNCSPDWGANGLIVFSSLTGGSFSICVLDPATLQVSTITTDGATYEDPSWARDGRHVACGRSMRYRSSICLVDTLTKEKVMLTEGQGDWYSPNWQK